MTQRGPCGIWYGNAVFVVASILHASWAIALFAYWPTIYSLPTLGIYPILMLSGGNKGIAGFVLAVASIMGLVAITRMGMVKFYLLVLQQFILFASLGSMFIATYEGHYPDGYYPSSPGFIATDHVLYLIFAICHAYLLWQVGKGAAKLHSPVVELKTETGGLERVLFRDLAERKGGVMGGIGGRK